MSNEINSKGSPLYLTLENIGAFTLLGEFVHGSISLSTCGNGTLYILGQICHLFQSHGVIGKISVLFLGRVILIMVHQCLISTGNQFFSQNLLDKKIPLLLLSRKRGTYH